MTHAWGSCLILNVSDSWEVMVVNLGVFQVGLMSVHFSVNWRFPVVASCIVIALLLAIVMSPTDILEKCLRYDLMPIENKLDHF